MIHEYKTYSNFFQKIYIGEKDFEIRLADKEIKVGDTLVLKEIDENRNYTGREMRKIVKYIAKTKDCDYWPKEEIEKCGFQVMGFD